MSTPPAVVPAAETPERLAFYERIGQKHMTPLWTSLAKLVTPGAGQRLPAGVVVVRRGPRRDDRGGRAHHRQGGRAPRADPRESRPARAVEDHDRPLRRRAARAAGRGRTRTSAYAERPALRARRRRRAHGRERRADADALRRLHHHAADGVARPRQRDRPADVLARRAGHSDRPVPRRLVRRAPRRGRAADRAAGRRCAGALRLEPAAGRPASGGRRLAGLQLSVRAHARGAGAARAQPTPGIRATASRCATAIP